MRTQAEMNKHELSVWKAVYGAYIALKVRDHARDGKGRPNEEEMRGFAEEAIEVAYLAVECMTTDDDAG